MSKHKHCECGCGERVNLKWNKSTRFVAGHQRRGAVVPEEQKERQRQALQVFYSDDDNLKKHKRRMEKWWDSKSEIFKKAFALEIKERWEDKDYREKMTKMLSKRAKSKKHRKIMSKSIKRILEKRWKDPDEHIKQSLIMYARYEDPEFYKSFCKSMKKASKDKEMCARRAETLKATINTPEGIQKKSDIMIERWKDPKYRKHMAQYGHHNYERGYLDTVKGGNVYYKSGWELAFVQILDSSSIVKKFICEPFGIRYKFEGEYHNYYPDYLIGLKDGRRLIVEIKGPKYPEWPAKKKAAEKFCSKYGYEYLVLYEKPMKSLSRYVQ